MKKYLTLIIALFALAGASFADNVNSQLLSISDSCAVEKETIDGVDSLQVANEVISEEASVDAAEAMTRAELLAKINAPIEMSTQGFWEDSNKKLSNFFDKMNDKEKFGEYTPLREFEWTAAPLVAFGLIAKADKKNFRAARNNFIPSYKNRFDDVLQHGPLILTTAMKLVGYEGRSDFWRYLASGAASYAAMAVFVNGIKYTAKEMRPDGSTANSFPSGHTATAFVAATIMHKEYGLTRSPWWSVAAYGMATTTGIMRTLNNRHWISDILVGAGIGVISTDIGYMIGDYIFKKDRIKRNPREGSSDMLKYPSFFKLSLGMTFANDLKMPTNTMYLVGQRLWGGAGAAELTDDYYQVTRRGNPFRVPDDFNATDRTYRNYAGTHSGGSTFYKDPKIKVSTGTSVGAEAAYFFNKYFGVGARLRITTAPVYAEGLSSYDSQLRLLPSNSASDVWSIADASAGVYLAWPISSKHNVNFKALYGRRFFGELDLTAKSDLKLIDQVTGEELYSEVNGDNLYIYKTNTDDLTLGLSYTYSLNNGVAISAFFDYDSSRPKFDVEYTPYHTDSRKMFSTATEFSFKQKLNTCTLGASMTVLF